MSWDKAGFPLASGCFPPSSNSSKCRQVARSVAACSEHEHVNNFYIFLFIVIIWSVRPPFLVYNLDESI
ncbi:hypothetical protein SeMB42_g00880 [Synchytrium endobioticum]|uniref:Uncharacterized protein n=1 Tax=Synchytrium endobioticum TaxID=286115 RepID=A0A507DNX8_9FUNG|nr:hypothetical protein SeMB42_g00880 [Synchytrium endobioticum]